MLLPLLLLLLLLLLLNSRNLQNVNTDSEVPFNHLISTDQMCKLKSSKATEIHSHVPLIKLNTKHTQPCSTNQT